jgi:hypothetical protein
MARSRSDGEGKCDDDIDSEGRTTVAMMARWRQTVSVVTAKGGRRAAVVIVRVKEVAAVAKAKVTYLCCLLVPMGIVAPA